MSQTLAQADIVIDCSQGDVFAYVSELTNYPNWFPGIASMAPIDDSPFSLGKKYKEVAFLPNGLDETVEVEVDNIDAPHSFSIQADLEPLRPRFTYRAEALSDNRTRFSWTARRTTRGPKPFLVSLIAALILKSRSQRALSNLKRILEGNASLSMKAAIARGYGPAEEVLSVDATSARPTPAKGEVLVRQAYSSLNHIDVARRQGYGRKLFALKGVKGSPIILGHDICGEVVAISPGVDGLTHGDAVFGVKGPSVAGSHAEYVAVKADQLVQVPTGCDPRQLACLPYVFLTAWSALVGSSGLTPDNASKKRIFIQGGAGAVGSMAVQIAKSWGAYVVLSCHTDDIEWAQTLKADRVLDYTKGEVYADLSDFDIGLCCADASEIPDMLEILKKNAGAVHATVIHPTLALGDELGPVKGLLRAKAMRKAINRTQAKAGRRVEWVLFAPDRTGMEAMATMLDKRALNVRIDQHYKLEDMVQAHQALEAGLRGKALIEISPLLRQ